MGALRTIDVAERRARLGVRHALAAPADKSGELFGKLAGVMANDHVILPILSPDAVFVSRKGISGLRFSACCNMVLSDIKAE